jgi:hypothetical protein
MEEKLRAAWNEGRNQIGNPRAAAIGFNHPNAVGPCRVQWLESFNNGAFGAPFSLVGK